MADVPPRDDNDPPIVAALWFAKAMSWLPAPAAFEIRDAPAAG
jgi:hypothetical protein